MSGIFVREGVEGGRRAEGGGAEDGESGEGLALRSHERARSRPIRSIPADKAE